MEIVYVGYVAPPYSTFVETMSIFISDNIAMSSKLITGPAYKNTICQICPQTAQFSNLSLLTTFSISNNAASSDDDDDDIK